MGWIGAILLVMAGVGMGLYASHRLRRQVIFLETCDRLLQALWQEMNYTAQPIQDLWRRLASAEAFATFALVQYTSAELEHATFTAAFAAAVKRAETEGWLLPPTRQTLLEFGQGCGRTDLQGQRAHMEYYRGLLSDQAGEARRRWQEKGRVYRVLGLTGGVALALLLM